jgi:hypothetical protein
MSIGAKRGGQTSHDPASDLGRELRRFELSWRAFVGFVAAYAAGPVLIFALLVVVERRDPSDVAAFFVPVGSGLVALVGIGCEVARRRQWVAVYEQGLSMPRSFLGRACLRWNEIDSIDVRATPGWLSYGFVTDESGCDVGVIPKVFLDDPEFARLVSSVAPPDSRFLQETDGG